MAKKNRLTHEQKRKAKLVERARRSPEPVSLAYTGNKYKTDELTPVYMSTETGIYETFVMTDRKLTDRTVSAALTKLLGQMQRGPLPPLNQSLGVESEAFEENFIVFNIRRNWQALFETERHPGPEKMRGVLRTLLGSITFWTSPDPHSRGYLHYIEGFLKKMGVSVRKFSQDMKPVPAPPEDELLKIGRYWCDGDDEAGERFREQLDDLIGAGKTEKVVAICQRLLGETGTGPRMADLLALSLKAQRAMQIGMS